MAPVTLTTQEQAYLNTFGPVVKTASAEGIGTVEKLQGFSGLSPTQQNAVSATYQNLIGAFLVAARPQWVTTGYNLSPDWSLNADPEYSLGVVRFYKDITGRVFLEGLVRAPASPTAFSNILTLPVGYRPDSSIICPSVSNDGFASLSINALGEVFYRGTPTALAWVSLNINFLA